MEMRGTGNIDEQLVTYVNLEATNVLFRRLCIHIIICLTILCKHSTFKVYLHCIEMRKLTIMVTVVTEVAVDNERSQ